MSDNLTFPEDTEFDWLQEKYVVHLLVAGHNLITFTFLSLKCKAYDHDYKIMSLF